MKRFFSIFVYLFLCLSATSVHASLPNIDEAKTRDKLKEIMSMHATQKELTPVLMRRALSNFIDELDPNKTYFTKKDIATWLDPCDALIAKLEEDYTCTRFCVFDEIHEKMLAAIDRRRQIEQNMDDTSLPTDVNPTEFKDLEWVETEEELEERLSKLKSLQIEATKKVMEESPEKTLQRIQKRQLRYEEKIRVANPEERKKFILSRILKAFASSLDSQTNYFTPDEANQFLISVQQRLFGIGAQLRDDLNGFTVVKVVDGGPAHEGKDLKAKDRIIAIDGEPVIGWDIIDAVELIRGEEGTDVILTVIRTTEDSEEESKEETLKITITRGEVVLKESRYEVKHEPFGDGVIAYIKLFSFYQDPEHSSAKDIARELNKIREEHTVLGVILDLRYNPGGLLTQAVEVSGLFITRGVVVSIMDEKGKIQHLRDIDEESIWNGPLVVMINRSSASASEIVAQTLQDYGRALVVGDDRSFGKGSFQTFTLHANNKGGVNPEGEFKVTRGRYYTVSGKSPQLNGVISDIIVPGALSEAEIGETYSKFPLDSDEIEPNFEDSLSDIPFFQRSKIPDSYKKNLQPKLDIYPPLLPLLKENSAKRIENNTNYQNFLKEVQKKDKSIESDEEEEFGQNDLQLAETHRIMKDLILMILIRKNTGELVPNQAKEAITLKAEGI